MNKDMFDKYSKVILSSALKIKKGDVLWLKAEPVHLEFAKLLVQNAYKLGAKYVNVSLEDPAFNRIKFTF